MRETSAFVEIVSKPARVFIDTYQPIHDGNGKTNLKGRTYTYQSTLDKGTTSWFYFFVPYGITCRNVSMSLAPFLGWGCRASATEKKKKKGFSPILLSSSGTRRGMRRWRRKRRTMPLCHLSPEEALRHPKEERRDFQQCFRINILAFPLYLKSGNVPGLSFMRVVG